MQQQQVKKTEEHKFEQKSGNGNKPNISEHKTTEYEKKPTSDLNSKQAFGPDASKQQQQPPYAAEKVKQHQTTKTKEGTCQGTTKVTKEEHKIEEDEQPKEKPGVLEQVYDKTKAAVQSGVEAVSDFIDRHTGNKDETETEREQREQRERLEKDQDKSGNKTYTYNYDNPSGNKTSTTQTTHTNPNQPAWQQPHQTTTTTTTNLGNQAESKTQPTLSEQRTHQNQPGNYSAVGPTQDRY